MINKLSCSRRHFIGLICPVFIALLVWPFAAAYGSVTATVNVIIDKLPIDEQQKMKDFHKHVKDYVESVPWFEDKDEIPVDVTLQLFLTDIPTNVEDRYKCEFLISSSDVQYFDKRVRFAYEPGDVLIYNEQSVEPHTGVIDFYMNMVLGNELDKLRSFGGDFYYKRAQSIAALGKFVRTEFIRGWAERDELIKRVFQEPFKTFREMKDYYFYGIYVRKENPSEAYEYVRTALSKLETVIEKNIKGELEEPRQFLDAHYLEIIDLFKDTKNKEEVFKLLIKIDPDHQDLYKEHVGDS
ncbi:DUF4835 family protein [bacterium]|nr:DUF4835 family protein [bacterium]